jgi:hypothetical protein
MMSDDAKKGEQLQQVAGASFSFRPFVARCFPLDAR